MGAAQRGPFRSSPVQSAYIAWQPYTGTRNKPHLAWLPPGIDDLTVEFADGAEHVIRILYVEDNEDNVYMLKMRLELTEAFEVLVAEDGEKGCAMAAAEQPALILMDLEMPVVDGWEAARRLKNDATTRHIPIIGLSAHALAADREKALAAGCEEFDTKPVEFERLLGTIRRLLESSKPMVSGQCA